MLRFFFWNLLSLRVSIFVDVLKLSLISSSLLSSCFAAYSGVTPFRICLLYILLSMRWDLR